MPRRQMTAEGLPLLTAKETIFIAVKLAFGENLNAALLAGYAPKSAPVSASRILRKPLIRATMANIKQRITESA